MSACYDFIVNLVSTAIGACLGFLGAWYLEKRRENKEKRERFNLLRESLCNVLKHNKELLEQLREEVRPDYVVFYHIDLLALKETQILKYEGFDNSIIAQKIDRVRYELEHLQRKIDKQFELAFQEHLQNQRARIVQSIQAHIPSILKEVEELLFILCHSQK